VGAPNKVACEAAGVSPSTLYGWLDRAKEKPASDYGRFAEMLTRARHEGVVARMAQVQKAAAEGDWRAAAWLLERDLPARFGPPRAAQDDRSRRPTFAEALASLRSDRPRLLEGPAGARGTGTC
jgi:hypothetical protein